MKDMLNPKNRMLQEPRWSGHESTIETGRLDVPPSVPNVLELSGEVTCDMPARAHYFGIDSGPAYTIGIGITP